MEQLLRALRKIAQRIGFDVIRYRDPNLNFPQDFDAETVSIWRAMNTFTMTTPIRISTLCDAVKYLERNGIPGSIVECGVWRGGCMMAVAKTLLGLKSCNRQLYLFDTFEGMPPATDVDIDLNGVSAQSSFGDQQVLPWQPEPLEGVMAALNSTGYPMDHCTFVKGKVEDTAHQNVPDAIALLRLDTDWYESTRHEMIHLFPRIVKGGVLIIDDYGYWKGARKAVDEYIAENNLCIFLCRIDESARMAIIQ